MEIVKYPSDESVKDAIKADEPFLATISFDGKKDVMCQIDEAMEHHILLMNVGYKDTEFYRDGIYAISDFLESIGYIVGINIPKRYRRHFNIMNEE